MTNQHPITPPPELVEKWHNAWINAKVKHDGLVNFITTQAAQWGADQELDACCELIRDNDGYDASLGLRAARRPEPPSLKEQAFGALGRFNSTAHTRADEMTKDFDLLRRALEAL
tara:strand:- start:218 stop:562 length:345 start_codon:yes stop_codon:yes gene_type:complete